MLRIWMASLLLALSALALGLPPPLPIIPEPSPSQTAQTAPADLFNNAASPVTQAWLLPVNQHVPISDARSLVSELQAEDFNAFYIVSGDQASVYVGPEASMDKLQETAAALKKQSLPVENPIPYNPFSQTAEDGFTS